MLKVFAGGKHRHKLELSQKLRRDIAEIESSDYLSKLEKNDRIEKLRNRFTEEVRNLKENLY